MGRQFPNVNSAYGAPMGRRESPLDGPRVRVFRVRMNSGGYDDGGAYWGIGQPLWCAQDMGTGRRFVRANSRLSAIVALGIEARDMARPPRAEYRRLRELEARGNLGASGVILRQELDNLGFA